MRKSGRVLAALLFFGALFFIAGCRCQERGEVTQVSTINALMAGVYDGEVACRDLLRHGNYGIGTFDALDGEMVVCDGKVWQVKSDGSVSPAADGLKTPFATVFEYERGPDVFVLKGVDFKGLCDDLERRVGNKNLFYAVIGEGSFEMVRARSVPAQQKPYPTLAEAAKKQGVFESWKVHGKIIGFRCPDYVGGINVPGWHLHFISDERPRPLELKYRMSGGHVLDFKAAEISVDLQALDKFRMILPNKSADFGKTDLRKDTSEDLRKIER